MSKGKKNGSKNHVSVFCGLESAKRPVALLSFFKLANQLKHFVYLLVQTPFVDKNKGLCTASELPT